MLTRDDLLMRIESKAEWRRRKAAEYPDDIRNANSADALAALAKFVAALPADDPDVIAAGAAFDNEDAAPDYMLGRVGFWREPSATDVESLRVELRRLGRQGVPA